MNDQKSRRTAQDKDQFREPYEPPILKEHGDAKEVTLQTFFGTFSPDSSN